MTKMTLMEKDQIRFRCRPEYDRNGVMCWLIYRYVTRYTCNGQEFVEQNIGRFLCTPKTNGRAFENANRMVDALNRMIEA